MIAIKSRVPREDISYILKKGNLHSSKLFIIRFQENNKHFSRYRVIISKKLESEAVKRNRLRRQIYEAIRVNSSENKQKGLDIILIPKKNIKKMAFSQITKDLTDNVIRANNGKI